MAFSKSWVFSLKIHNNQPIILRNSLRIEYLISFEKLRLCLAVLLFSDRELPSCYKWIRPHLLLVFFFWNQNKFTYINTHKSIFSDIYFLLIIIMLIIQNLVYQIINMNTAYFIILKQYIEFIVLRLTLSYLEIELRLSCHYQSLLDSYARLYLQSQDFQ